MVVLTAGLAVHDACGYIPRSLFIPGSEIIIIRMFVAIGNEFRLIGCPADCACNNLLVCDYEF